MKLRDLNLKKTDKKWQKQFCYLLEVLKKQHQDKFIVIMLDEFTIMLNKVKISEAINILGFLRDLVQHECYKKIRFVFCGSIGIDLVLDKFKRGGHNIGDPINHMSKQRLLPFEDDEALFFCKCLNRGCKLKLSIPIMKYICKLADNIPYFIDKLFDNIRDCDNINETIINRGLNDILDDPNDQNNLKHLALL